jgi:hypothetical protein
MKFPGFTAVVTALLVSVQHVHADFHISLWFTGPNFDPNPKWIAFASSDYNCDNFAPSISHSVSNINTLNGGRPLPSFFTFGTDFCGEQYKINFYENSDGTYDFYQNDGDGALLGTCYPDAEIMGCDGGNVGVQDVLYCTSSVCGPS